MNVLKVEYFPGGGSYNDLVKWVKKNKIKREDIQAITNDQGTYTLFYFGLED